VKQKVALRKKRETQMNGKFNDINIAHEKKQKYHFTASI
jgi:hypothetical protein